MGKLNMVCAHSRRPSHNEKEWETDPYDFMNEPWKHASKRNNKTPRTNIVCLHLKSTKSNQIVMAKGWMMEAGAFVFNGTALVWGNEWVLTPVQQCESAHCHCIKKKVKMRARYYLLVECLLNVSENSGLNSRASTVLGEAKIVIFVIYVLPQFIKKI